MEELNKIWKRQKDFNELLKNKANTIEEKEALTKEFILHLITEATELLNEINWKMHREKVYNKYNPIKESRLKDEIIDIFKYWLSIAQFWNMSPKEFISEFNRKSEVVEQRYKQEKQLNLLKDKKIIGLDLDGCIADYPKSYYNFIFKKTGKRIKDDGTYNIFKNVSDVLGEERAKQLKREYRESGEKRFIKTINNPDEFTKNLKEKGYKIIILSARPYKEYSRVFADTIEWLKKKNILCDAIIFDENKEEKIINKFPNMNFMIEDCAEIALKIANKGYKVYLIDKTYNQNIQHKNIVRIKTLKDIKI